MPELRRDEMTGRWVLLAPGRAGRPHTAAEPEARGAPAACPFCPGHEHETPPEVARTGEGAPDTPGWRVRVVPNLYPVVGGDGAGPGATGAHEVVVLSPAHERSFGHLAGREAAEVFEVLRDRVRHHLEAGWAFVQPLINQGRAAGASIAHPHAQLIALDFVPPAVGATRARFQAAGADLVAEAAARAGDRGLGVLEGAAPAWCPEAATSPFEVRVAHREARARFEEAGDAEVAAVARTVRHVVARLAAIVGDTPYNVVIHTAPPGAAAFFHWYVEVHPRLSVLAGFELGTGVFVNVVDPFEAAARLRESPS